MPRLLTVITGVSVLCFLLTVAGLDPMRGRVARDAALLAAEELSPWQQSVLTQLGERRSVQTPRMPQLCFAPGTPPEVMAQFYDNIQPDLELYRLGLRWSTTATQGSGLQQGDPTTLTYSFIPDGTLIPSAFTGDPAGPSTLFANFNAIPGYGAPATWQALFTQVFNVWAGLTGNTYVFQNTDDGAAFPTSPGLLGVRGDVRIGGRTIDGNSGTLAYNYFPNTGDMVMDAPDTFYLDTTANSLRLRNVVSHEHGHGLALSHVCPTNQSKLMEPFISTMYDGPQFDDRLGGNRGYGDQREPNDSTGTATNLMVLPNGTTTPEMELSIDDSSATDVDYFQFSTGAGSKTVQVTMRPLGSTYLEGPQNPDGSCTPGANFNALTALDLGVRVLRADGTTVLATANSQPAGVNETTAVTALPDGTGPYFVHVFGPGSVATAQMYAIDILIADANIPTLTVTKAGSGTGTVTSVPMGIDCGVDCSESYAAGTPVTLTATPDMGSTAVLTGDADCTDNMVTLNTNTSCKAVFAKIFSNDPLGVATPILAAHISELRMAINQLRNRGTVNLGDFGFTDGTIVPGVTVVRAVHLNQLRDALDAVYTRLMMAPPMYAETITATSTTIKASHVNELRQKIRDIDAAATD